LKPAAGSLGLESPKHYPAAEVERIMKLQDVLLKAMAKKITWWEAAEIIGVTDRTMRRWRERLQEGGYSGLADRRKGRPSDKRVPLALVEEVLRRNRWLRRRFGIIPTTLNVSDRRARKRISG
jgi:transposase